jgi:ribonuclease P protein component
MRFGFIVSQKVSKKAVIRNRVKRRFRSAVQEELGCGKNPKNSTKCFQKSMDVVLIALPAAKEKSFAEIHEGVKRAFGRVGVLN